MSKYKFGEPSKLISLRVPESRYDEFRDMAQEAIDNHYYGNGERVENTDKFKAALRTYHKAFEYIIEGKEKEFKDWVKSHEIFKGGWTKW